MYARAAVYSVVPIGECPTSRQAIRRAVGGGVDVTAEA